jgi:hypothetical protein
MRLDSAASMAVLQQLTLTVGLTSSRFMSSRAAGAQFARFGVDVLCQHGSVTSSWGC